MQIRPARRADAEECTAIYNHWVRHSVGTFDVTGRDARTTEAWYRAHQQANHPLLVVEIDGRIAGWGSLSPWSTRQAYGATAEISVFVHPRRLRRGVGRALVEALVRHARAAALRVLIARVEAGNAASVALFGNAGFGPVGTMQAVGFKFGRWLDVLVMQLDLRPDTPPAPGQHDGTGL